MTKILGTGNSDSLSDPQIAWDQDDRAVDRDGNGPDHRRDRGVGANTADPVGGLVSTTGSRSGSKLCPDQPRLGSVARWSWVATELFTGNCHSDIRVRLSGELS